MQKIISFSLWGDNPKYTIGAIKNAYLAKTIYPGWICRFYVGKSVPEDIVVQLRSCDNTELVEMDEEGDWRGMFWRFFAADNPHAIVLSRDTDSRLGMREKAAVDAWLASDKDFHIMRDHPGHMVRILGGMWGARNGILSGIIIKRISKYKKENFWQVDQNFLADKIYPLIKKKALIHDTLFERKPSEYEDWRFVGEPFDENDIRDGAYKALRDYFISELDEKGDCSFLKSNTRIMAQIKRLIRLCKKILSLICTGWE